MNKTYVVDANILLRHPEVVTTYNIEVPLVVVQELDHLKRNSDVAFEARRATRYIEDSSATINEKYRSTVVTNDDIILECAKNSNSILLTNDTNLKLKARAFGVEYEDPIKTTDEIYKGYKKVRLSDSQMAEVYQNTYDNIFGLYANQYLIMQNDEGHTVDRLKWLGDKLVTIKLPPSKVIKPLNDLQACALDMLMDKDVPIKILAGTYGSGKTLLNIRMGLWHVMQKGNYSKITLVRNPIGSGEAIGFIKGTKEEKTEPFYKPIEQNLEGGEIQLKQMIFNRQLEMEIPYYIKGQSISSSWIMVDEAEDMDKKLIKLIGTRISENSAMIFSGDWNQAESKYVKDNGLTYLLNKTKDNPLVGAVVLDTDVRSDASKVFAELV